MLDAGLISLIIASSAATIGLIVRYALLSKCDNVKMFWGCCEIHRNTNEEVRQPPESPNRITPGSQV
jgi:hypothetical protein